VHSDAWFDFVEFCLIPRWRFFLESRVISRCYMHISYLAL
jgi:hypothetical protein